MNHRLSLRNLAPHFGFFFFILAVLPSCGQAPKKVTSLTRVSSSQNVIYPVNELKSRFPKSEVGYILYDPKNQEILSSWNESKVFIPASTTKIFMAIAALKILGPEHRFKTQLLTNGHAIGNTFHGDVYLKGSGDPRLSISHLMDLSRSLTDRGIHRITGQFFYDETEVISTQFIKEFGDSASGHNPGISALSLDFNQAQLDWKAVAGSETEVQYQFIPDLPGFEFSLSDETIPSKTEFAYRPQLAQNSSKEQWFLSPRGSRNGSRRVPIKNPGEYTVQLFSEFSRMNGLALPNPIPKKSSKKLKLLTQHTSAPLMELIEQALEHSNNMMSELIFLAAAKKLTGKAVTLDQASVVLQNWMKQNLNLKTKKSDPKNRKRQEQDLWNTMILENGSGLTSKNRVSPAQLIAALNFADQPEFSSRRFETLLPVSGWKGTLSRRLDQPDSAFRVWAKTGTMYFASALAGYLHTYQNGQGRRLIFAIMQSDFSERAGVDSLQDEVSGAPLSKANLWTEMARRNQDNIVRNWLAGHYLMNP